MKIVSPTASLVVSALSAAVLMPALAHADPAAVPGYKFDKCYGVNVAGKNDCASTGSHGCAAQGTRARDAKAWIYVPAGTCSKIDGGSTTAKAS